MSMKWCGLYQCWCDDVGEVIEEDDRDCDIECDYCEHLQEV